MKKTGLFYGAATAKSAAVAEKIRQAYGKDELDIVPIEEAAAHDFKSYDQMIVGTATWFDGELPTYWDEVVPELSHLDLKGKKVAIFGLGDQTNYPDNFVDGIGLLADIFTTSGATLVGRTSPDGYYFNQSKALRDGKLLGLAIDIDNQPDLTDERVREWVKQIKEEFAASEGK